MRPATLADVELIVAERIADLERRIAPRALSVRQVAERLDLSVTRVKELVYSGELPSYTIGKSRRVDPSDLTAFLADRRKTNAPTMTATRASKPAGNWLEDFRREAYG